MDDQNQPLLTRVLLRLATATWGISPIVREGSTRLNLDQNKLTAPANAGNYGTLQFAIKDGSGQWKNQFWEFDLSRDNSAAHYYAAQGTHDVLDFGKLRHGGSV